MWGSSGMQEFKYCTACHQSYCIITKRPFDLMTGLPKPLASGESAPEPIIEGPSRCFVGVHTAEELPCNDRRRTFASAVTLKSSSRLQEDIDLLPATVRILAVVKGDASCGSSGAAPQALTLARHLPDLEDLSLLDCDFERIVLNGELTPSLRHLRIKNVPNKCSLSIELPSLKSVSIHGLHETDGVLVSRCDVVNTMLRHATSLETFESYKLWVEDLHFASNELVEVDLHRADALSTLRLFAPNLRKLNLQGCYQLDRIYFEEEKPEALANLAQGSSPPRLDVNTTNARLGRHAKAALKKHPNLVECSSNGREQDRWMLATRDAMLQAMGQ
jgi:hypothetical protein